MSRTLYIYEDSNSRWYLSLEPVNHFCKTHLKYDRLIHVMKDSDFRTSERLMNVYVSCYSGTIADYFLSGLRYLDDFIKQARRRVKELKAEYDRLVEEDEQRIKDEFYNQYGHGMPVDFLDKP